MLLNCRLLGLQAYLNDVDQGVLLSSLYNYTLHPQPNDGNRQEGHVSEISSMFSSHPPIVSREN